MICAAFVKSLLSALLQSTSLRDAGTDLGSSGPEAILVFGAPRRCDIFGRLSQKRERMPLLCAVPPQKYTFGCAEWIYDGLRSSTELFLHSSQEQMAIRCFLGIYRSLVYFRNSLDFREF